VRGWAGGNGHGLVAYVRDLPHSWVAGVSKECGRRTHSPKEQYPNRVYRLACLTSRVGCRGGQLRLSGKTAAGTRSWGYSMPPASCVLPTPLIFSIRVGRTAVIYPDERCVQTRDYSIISVYTYTHTPTSNIMYRARPPPLLRHSLPLFPPPPPTLLPPAKKTNTNIQHNARLNTHLSDCIHCGVAGSGHRRSPRIKGVAHRYAARAHRPNGQDGSVG
jgi:hypothetical protein